MTRDLRSAWHTIFILSPLECIPEKKQSDCISKPLVGSPVRRIKIINEGYKKLTKKIVYIFNKISLIHMQPWLLPNKKCITFTNQKYNPTIWNEGKMMLDSLVHNHGIGKIGVETKFRIEKTKKYKDILNLLLWSKPWSGSHFMFWFLSERTHCSWIKRQHMMSSLSALTWRRPFYQLEIFGSVVILSLLAY